MKKENIFKEIIVPSLLGFPIGITLLMIAYISTYLISEDNIFKNEIVQLQDVHTLFFQLLIIGCAYYLFLVFVCIGKFLNKVDYSNKFVVEHPWKTLLIMLVVLALTIIVFIFLTDEIFSENIRIMNIVIFMIIFTLIFLYLCIRSLIQSNIIKAINQKIKEKNS